MANVAELGILISAKDAASGVLGNVKREAGGLGGVLGGALKVGALAAVAGIGTLAGAVVACIPAAIASEESWGRLQKAVENTGVAYSDAAGPVKAAIQSAKDMGFAGSDARDALSLLEAQTGDVTEANKRFALAQDLSRGANIDLTTASKLLGKVTDENVNVLARYGIKATAGMDATALFGMVQEKFGGQAATFAKSTAGLMTILGTKMGDLKVQIGTALLPVVVKLADFALTKLIPVFQQLVTEWQNLAAEWIPKLQEGIGGVADALSALAHLGFVTAFVQGLRDGISDLRDRFNDLAALIPKAVGIIKDALSDIPGLDKIKEFADNAAGQNDKVRALGKGFVEAAAGVVVFAGASAALSAGIGTISNVGQSLVSMIEVVALLPNTFLVVVAAVAALVGGLYIFEQKTKWISTNVLPVLRDAFKDVQQYVGFLWAMFERGFSGKTESGLSGIKNLAFNFGQTLRNNVIPALKDAVEWIKTDLLPAVERLGTWIMSDGLPALQRFGGVLKNDVLPALKSIGAWIVDNVLPQLIDLGNLFKTIAVEYIKGQVIPALDTLSSLWANLYPVLQNLGNLLKEYVLPVLKQLGQFMLEHKPLIIALAAAILLLTEPWLAVVAAIILVLAKWDEISQMFTVTIPGAIDNVITKIKELPIIGAIFTSVWADVQTVTKYVWDTIQNYIDIAMNVIKDIIKIATALIQGDWSEAWNGIKQLFTDIWGGIQAQIGIVLDLIRGIVGDKLALVAQLWADFWNGLLAGADLLATQIVNFGTTVFAWFLSLPSTMLTIGGDMVTALWNGIQAMSGWLLDKVKGFVGGLLDIINPFNWDLPGHSPLVEAYGEIGQQAGTALGGGIVDGLQSTLGAVTDQVKAVKDAVAEGVAAAVGEATAAITAANAQVTAAAATAAGGIAGAAAEGQAGVAASNAMNQAAKDVGAGNRTIATAAGAAGVAASNATNQAMKDLVAQQTAEWKPEVQALVDSSNAINAQFGPPLKAIQTATEATPPVLDTVTGAVGDVNSSVMGGFASVLTNLRDWVIVLLSHISAQSNRLDLLFPIRDALTSIPSAQHGGAVLSPGLVRVHAGEAIVPAGRGLGAGNTYNLNVGVLAGDTASLDRLTRYLDQHYIRRSEFRT